MKVAIFRISIFLILCFSLSYSLDAQVIRGDLRIGDTTQVHRVVTERGDVFVGRIIEIQNTDVRFIFNETIELKFRMQELKEISVLGPGQMDKRKEQENGDQVMHGHERGFYLPSGFLLKKGEKEFRNMGFVYNSFETGITDHINLGFGGIPLIVANAFQLKLRGGASIGPSVHLSLNGNAYVGLVISEPIFTAGAVTGAVSFGNADRHLTLGAGYAAGFGSGDSGATIAQIAGSYRFSNHWRAFLEGVVPVNSGGGILLLTGGANWVYRQHRVEFGWSVLRIDFSIAPFPIAGYGFRF